MIVTPFFSLLLPLESEVNVMSTFVLSEPSDSSHSIAQDNGKVEFGLRQASFAVLSHRNLRTLKRKHRIPRLPSTATATAAATTLGYPALLVPLGSHNLASLLAAGWCRASPRRFRGTRYRDR